MNETLPPPRVAVLFLVFNRPDVTAKVFAAIRAARPPRLYVAADGPRPERVGEAERSARTRKIATAIDWPCELHTLFRDENLGCKMAVSSAINWFFEHEERGIILEDDCLPTPSFFPFCETLLERYKDDTRVLHIGGTNSLRSASKKNNSYYFSRYVAIWGWASWRRAWAQYDVEMGALREVERDGLINQIYVPSAARHFSRLFARVSSGEIDTWDYQWQFTCGLQGLAIVPDVNLISNLGFGDDATHTTDTGNPMSRLPVGEIRFPLRHPIAFATDKVRDSDWERFAFRRRPIRMTLIKLRENFRGLRRYFDV